MRREACLAVALIGGCFFPSVDGLSRDGGVDAVTPEAASPEAGICPPNTDPSLVVYYPCNEGSGTLLHDCSGHGYDAVLGGIGAATSWTTGHTGSAVLYVPADSICAATSSPAANLTGGAFTATAWIKPFDPENGYIVGQRHTAGWAWRIDLETDSDAGPTLDWGVGNDGGSDHNTLVFVTAGVWHFVAGVFDPAGPTEVVYVDGNKTTSFNPPAFMAPDPVASTIGLGCRQD